MRSKVSIVGAGAVGLYLAYKLASDGIDVTIYDGKRNIRDRSDTASGYSLKGGLSVLR
jgi:Ketopantoate reductase PanE/ApbA.